MIGRVFLTNFIISWLLLPAIAAYASSHSGVQVADQIRSYTLKIGSEMRIVRDGEQTNLMAGQRFQLHHIERQNGKAFNGALKVEYRNRAGAVKRRDVPLKWSMELRELSGNAAVPSSPYTFLFLERGKTVGTLRVQEVIPEFSYVDLTINGESRVFRDRDVMNLDGADKFKVKKIATNLGDLTDEIKVKIIPATEVGAIGKIQQYEMQFLHNDAPIAKISMRVKNP